MSLAKLFRFDCQKSLVAVLILQFVSASFLVFNVNVKDVSATPVSPYIKVAPERIINSTMTVGTNFTVSLYTDYAGSDIFGWSLNLTFDPYVLHLYNHTKTDTWTGTGSKRAFFTTISPVLRDSEKVYVNNVLMNKTIGGQPPKNYTIDYTSGRINFNTPWPPPPNGTEVKATYQYGIINGDLITYTPTTPLNFIPGEFDNTAGILSATVLTFAASIPPITTTGPGTLANITFTVVHPGISNITLEGFTALWGPPPPPDYQYAVKIIDSETMPDHIGHGYFDNLPNVHDVAVSKLETPTTAIQGDIVAINVTVRSESNLSQTFDVKVFSNTTLVDTQPVVDLARGTKTTLTFPWNTTYSVPGNYTINATANLPEDFDLSDNAAIRQIEVKTIHDMVIVNLEISPEAFVGELVRINVTVGNNGNFEENAMLEVSYKQMYVKPEPDPVVINSTSLLLRPRPASQLVSMNWSTTDLKDGFYRINATVSIPEEEQPNDNTDTTHLVSLTLGHELDIIGVTPTPRQVFVGELIGIKVEVKNKGGYNETFEVKVSYDTTEIDTKLIESMTPENLTSLQFTWNTTGVVPSSYEITAEAFLPEDFNQQNNKKSYRFVFVNEPLGNINGTVVNAITGLPIEGATVVAGAYTNTTNADGYYLILNAQAGTYTVTASKDGYQSDSKTAIVVAGQTTNLNFSLTPTTGTITGIVTDASTGAPLEGANVTANGHSIVTDANGRYILSDMPEATYTVTASKDGYESSSKANVVVTAGQTTTVDLELKPVPKSDITLYIALAGIGIIVIAAVIIYFLKFRKRT